ncbi:MAG: AAA family ATPase [Rhizobacter sp.]
MAASKAPPPARPAEARKQATILFCDVCGSTASIQHLDVEEARDWLQQATQLMCEAVSAYGGNVFRIDGDGVLVVFGAPLGQEDQAVRACLAAAEIQRRAAARSATGFPLVTRAGIHSGEVIVWRDPGSRTDRVDGKSIHLAKRLQEFARPGTVLLSGATRRLLSGQVDDTPLGVHELRDVGKVALFELSVTAQHSAVDPLARRRLLGPLVGRQHALDSLAQVERQVRAGRLRVIGLRGEAGIGKSRVASEYARTLREAGFRDHWVCGRAYATHLPYAVIAELIHTLMGVPDGDPARQREAVRAIVAGWPADRRLHWSAAADLLDIGEHDTSLDTMPPAQRLRNIVETVVALAVERAAEAPLLVVVDDIYLADRESVRLLESLARRVEHQRVLLCATYRQDFVHRWGSAPWFTEHWIGPLETGDMADLARALLGRDAGLDPVVEALVERADGNPFFLEQMAMTLVDDGTLVGAPGDYHRGDADAEVRLPASIAAVIGARVDRLPPAAQGALEAAAIVGRPISGPVIGAMLGMGADEAEAHLSAAQSSGLMVAQAPADTSAPQRFEFRHALVQDAVTATLTRPRRKALHRAAFDALAVHFADQLGEQAAVLAHHAYDGEAWAEAAGFALRAMARAIACSAYRDALRLFTQGLDASRRIGDAQGRLASELSLRMKVLGAQLPLGQTDDIVTNLERAEAITQELGDTRRQAGVLLQLAVVLWISGSYRHGLDVASRAADTAATAGSPSVRMAAMQARLLLHHALGLYDQVVFIARQIEREFGNHQGMRQIMPGWAVVANVNLRTFLADVLWRMGRLDEAQAACDEAYRELDSQDHAFSRVLVDFVQAEVWMVQERHADALQRLRATLVSCQANDLTSMLPPVIAILAGCMAACGQPAEAVTLLEDAIEGKLPDTGGRYNAYYFPKYLALALARSGRLDEAVTAAQQARTAAASFGQAGHEADALVILAEIEADAGRARDAHDHFDEALSLARSRGIVVLEQRCEAGLARTATAAPPPLRHLAHSDHLFGSDDGE